jgi:hypothetical protein
VFLTEHYFASLSHAYVQGEFPETCPNSPVPHKTPAARLVHHFHESGSVNDTPGLHDF